MTRVVQLGLGTMGAGMAGRLLDAGFELAIYNRTPQRAEPLRQRGARVVATPAEASRDADFVIAMVADDHASRAVWTGDSGALAAVRPGTVLMEASTVTPEWIRELAALAGTRGCPLLDTPVTGSRPQAQNGELTFLVGGDPDSLDRARPVLQAMSRGIVHLGPTGAGATLKLVNNFLCGVQAAALAEALAWVERSGLDRDQAISVLTGGAPGSPLVKALAGRMCNRAYETNFRLDLMAKDLTYATAEAQRSGVQLTTGSASLQRFEEAVRAGLGASDLSAVVEPLRPKTIPQS